MARLTDEHLAEIVAANLGCSPEHRTEALEMALEIQQHRARIAAHATAHPERLSKRAVDVAIVNSESLGDAGLSRDETYAALLEIWQRRAAEPTFSEPEIDSLLGMRDFVQEQADYWRGKEYGDSLNEALAAFDKLLRSAGIDPQRST